MKPLQRMHSALTSWVQKHLSTQLRAIAAVLLIEGVIVILLAVAAVKLARFLQ